MAKILVIEDDAETAALLSNGLTEAGFQVESAQDGVEGIERVRASRFDVVVLDVQLPRCDGWSFLSQMRRVDRATPVLMLSALDAVEHRVRGLSAGADDYLAKPFSFQELALRIGIMHRRRAENSGAGLEDLVLDDRTMTARRGDDEIDLSVKEYQLLKLLLRHQGQALSREYIAEQVWDMKIDSDSNIVEVNIRRLRQKIDEPYARKLIRTVRGRGYVAG
jgi:two-component system copper resistance phosphate regulon response regulator CusR